MKIVCIHCGREFTIHAEDLGGEGHCPHCHGMIALPKATPPARAEAKPPRQRPTNWLEGSLSGLISLVLHTIVFIVVALFQATGGSGGAGEGQDVLIGMLPKTDLVDRPEEQLAAVEVEKKQSADGETTIEIEVPNPATSATAAPGDLSSAALSASGGEIGNFDLGTVRIGGAAGGGGGGSW